VSTVNLTADIEDDVCVAADCEQPLSIADDGRVAWVHTTREGGPRALLSTSNGQIPQHVVLLDENTTAVSIAANGKAAAVTRSADARRSVVVVDVAASAAAFLPCPDVREQVGPSVFDLTLDVDATSTRMVALDQSSNLVEIDVTSLDDTIIASLAGTTQLQAHAGHVVGHAGTDTFVSSFNDVSSTVSMDLLNDAPTQLLAAAPAPLEAAGFVVVVERTGDVRLIDPESNAQVGQGAQLTAGAASRAFVEPRDRDVVVVTHNEIALFDASLDGLTGASTPLDTTRLHGLVLRQDEYFVLAEQSSGPVLVRGSLSRSSVQERHPVSIAGQVVDFRALGIGFVVATTDAASSTTTLHVFNSTGGINNRFPVTTPCAATSMVVEDLTGSYRVWLSCVGSDSIVVDVSGCTPSL
jgi:hypothetical protein